MTKLLVPRACGRQAVRYRLYNDNNSIIDNLVFNLRIVRPILVGSR